MKGGWRGWARVLFTAPTLGALFCFLVFANLGVALSGGDNGTPWRHDFSTVTAQMWVDFAGEGYTWWPTESQWDFVAHNYAIVSIEKCFAGRKYKGTWSALIAAAKKLKSKNPNIKVLSYYNTLIAYAQCYHWGPTFLANTDWWLRTDSGRVYRSNPANDDTVWQDLANPQFAAWFLNEVTTIASNSADQRLIDGTFADQVKRAEYPFGGMSKKRNDAWLAAQFKHVNDTRQIIHRTFASRAKYFSNSISAGAGPGGTTGLEVVNYTDAGCLEHLNAHSFLNPANGSLVPQRYQRALETVEEYLRLGKNVLVKGWPGPITVGGWEKNSGLKTPTTMAGKAAAAADWLTASLAAYLIMAEDTTFFSYNWGWTGPDGVWPCCDGSCAAPCGWYPMLNYSLGKPQGKYVRHSGWTYERHFEFARVVFDAVHPKQSLITWLTPTTSASVSNTKTEAPARTPTASATVTVSLTQSVSVRSVTVSQPVTPSASLSPSSTESVTLSVAKSLSTTGSMSPSPTSTITSSGASATRSFSRTSSSPISVSASGRSASPTASVSRTRHFRMNGAPRDDALSWPEKHPSAMIAVSALGILALVGFLGIAAVLNRRRQRRRGHPDDADGSMSPMRDWTVHAGSGSRQKPKASGSVNHLSKDVRMALWNDINARLMDGGEEEMPHNREDRLPGDEPSRNVTADPRLRPLLHDEIGLASDSDDDNDLMIPSDAI